MMKFLAIAIFILVVAAAFYTLGLMAIPAIALWCVVGYCNILADRYVFGGSPELTDQKNASEMKTVNFLLGPIALSFYLMYGVLLVVLLIMIFFKNIEKPIGD